MPCHARSCYETNIGLSTAKAAASPLLLHLQDPRPCSKHSFFLPLAANGAVGSKACIVTAGGETSNTLQPAQPAHFPLTI
jgi:hypothetical protein